MELDIKYKEERSLSGHIVHIEKKLLRGEFGTFLPYERIENRKKL